MIATAVLLGLAALNPSTPYVGSSAEKVVVLNARSGTLPRRYAEKILQIPQVASLTWSNYLPLLCNTASTATLNGQGGPGTHVALRQDYSVDDGSIAAWDGDLMGILVGDKLARQCGWRRGMHLKPIDGFRGRAVEIHIIDIMKSTPDAPFASQIAIAHYEYIDRQADEDQHDQVSAIVARSKDPGSGAQLAATIDTPFAHADPPTESQQSNPADGGLQQFGNVQIVLYWVAAAILACVTLVLLSAMTHTASERRASFAVLRMLGFRGDFILAAFACEFALLVAVGLALGVLVGVAAIDYLAPTVSLAAGEFAPPSSMWLCLPLAFIGLLALGLILPALTIANTRAIDRRTS